jgi:hypothetical protein
MSDEDPKFKPQKGGQTQKGSRKKKMAQETLNYEKDDFCSESGPVSRKVFWN